jgi:hypothetical protein
VVISGPDQFPGTDLNLSVVNSSLRKSETTPRGALIMKQTPFLGQCKGCMRKQELGGCKAAGICLGVAGSGSEKSDLYPTWGCIPALEPTGQVPPLRSETGMGTMVIGELKAARPHRFKFARLILHVAPSQDQGRRGTPDQRRGL